jgi:hypothetical protein
MSRTKINLTNKEKGLQISNRTIEILQTLGQGNLKSFLEALIAYTAGDVVIMSGMVQTVSGTDPLTFACTAGVAYYNGDLYTVPEFTTTVGPLTQVPRLVVSNVNVNHKHGDNNSYAGETELRLVWEFGTSGSGVVNYNGAKLFKMANLGQLSSKIIPIGDWNMDTTSSINVAHGLSFSQIVGCRVMIRNDDNNTKTLFAEKGFFSGAELEGTFFVGSFNVTLNRLVGGFYDSADYNATSYNRGWIILDYIA